MPFTTRENSVFGGSPIKLYEFHRASGGADLYWRYNTSESDLVFSGATFKAIPISDDGVKQSGEAAGTDFIITMPAVEDFPQMFRGSGPVPSDQVFVTMRRLHAGETATVSEPLWSTGTNVSSGGTSVTVLAAGASMARGASVPSPSGEFILSFQSDGNLVLLQEPGDVVLWASGTNDETTDVLVMQTDGNLVIYDNYVPASAMWATGTDGHQNATLVLQDDGNLVVYTAVHVDARVEWVGTVSGITQPDEIQVKVTCATLAASFRRSGLRLAWTRGCPHALYDSECRADPNAFKTVATVESITGDRIISADFAVLGDDYFNGGYVEWVLASGAIERRFIKFNVGNDIVILGTTIGLSVSDTVTAFAGCQHTRTDCNDKFNNMSNYGGFAHTPGKSPFSGDPVF